MSGFILDPQLASDTLPLGQFPLCRVLLMNEQRYPWLVLVPQRPEASEVFDLSEPEGRLLWDEVRRAAETLKQLTSARKINIATLGNRVSQLHVHVIARNETDATWPGTVWDKGPRQPMDEATKHHRLSLLSHSFSVVR